MTGSPAVVIDPAVLFGRPAMKGISTEMVAGIYWEHGTGDLEAPDGYAFSRHELLVALWYEGSQGQPRFRRRWRAWAEQVGPVLWKVSELDPGVVELPPTRG